MIVQIFLVECMADFCAVFQKANKRKNIKFEMTKATVTPKAWVRLHKLIGKFKKVKINPNVENNYPRQMKAIKPVDPNLYNELISFDAKKSKILNS